MIKNIAREHYSIIKPCNWTDAYKAHSSLAKLKLFCLYFNHFPMHVTKGRLSYHLFIECFSQLSFDSEVYTKSAAVADFVYTSESNESCEKQSTQR